MKKFRDIYLIGISFIAGVLFIVQFVYDATGMSPILIHCALFTKLPLAGNSLISNSIGIEVVGKWDPKTCPR